MANLSFIVGIVGNVISILVFTSPIKTFRRVIKKKSTESFKWQPYVTTLMSTSMWTFYGLLKTDGLLVVTVNGAGSALQAVYVILYLLYAPMKTRIRMTKVIGLLNIGAFGMVVLVTLLAFHGNTKLLVIGSLCATLTVCMYAAPLSAMRLVVKTKSVEYMPFFLSFFLFLNGGVWSVYAVLVKDYFIAVPNAIGFILGTAQLVIYFIYKKSTPSTMEADIERAGEEDSAKLVSSKGLESERKDEGNGMRQLSKGRSLPKLSMDRQQSFTGIIKAQSLTPYELQSVWKTDGYNAL